MIQIYKITKPSSPMTIYIGKTTKSLSTRMTNHRSTSKMKPYLQVYQWYDNSCIIELIEVYLGDKKLAGIREMQLVQEYISNGYEVMNTRFGINILDNMYVSKSNAKKHPDYNNWQVKINYYAKKEGLSSKEYKIKYNIPEYSGPKTK